jgi:hypothetical protein
VSFSPCVDFGRRSQALSLTAPYVIVGSVGTSVSDVQSHKELFRSRDSVRPVALLIVGSV